MGNVVIGVFFYVAWLNVNAGSFIVRRGVNALRSQEYIGGFANRIANYAGVHVIGRQGNTQVVPS